MRTWPAELTEILAGVPRSWLHELARHELAPIDTGMSGASVLRIGAPESPKAYVKIARGPAASALSDEIARTRWLAQRGMRVPEITEVFETETATAMLMGAVAGVPAFSLSRHLARDIEAVARTLRQLHDLPVSGCPFDETVRVRLARAREDIDRGAVDPAHFDSRNAGINPHALWERLSAEIPEEELVVVHGDATASNILIDGYGNVGFIDCGRAGRSDRYTDLALMVEELTEGFGREAVEAFVRAYGVAQWNRSKALFFLDLYELF